MEGISSTHRLSVLLEGDLDKRFLDLLGTHGIVGCGHDGGAQTRGFGGNARLAYVSECI